MKSSAANLITGTAFASCLVLAQGIPSAMAHGRPAPAATPRAAPVTVKLPMVAVDDLRVSGSATSGDELEIAIRIDRTIAPPDPLLGASTPVLDAAVTLTVRRDGKDVAGAQTAHAEGEAGVYGVHLPPIPGGRYMLHVEIVRDGVPSLAADLPFELEDAPMAAMADSADGAMAMDMTHPFLAHMGLPDPPGAASVRITGIQRVGELGRGSDLAIHVEAGIVPRLGVHLRSDAITGAAAGDAMGPAEDHGSEVMLMYAFLEDAAQTRGVSVFAELSWPTFKGDMMPANAGVGLAARYQWRDRVLFDADMHVAADNGSVEVELEGSLQVRPAGRLYGILESRGNLGTGDRKVYLLPAVKVGLGRSNGTVGLGLQFPLTKARAYDRQAMFQLDWDF